jgi:hypothetical protein
MIITLVVLYSLGVAFFVGTVVGEGGPGISKAILAAFAWPIWMPIVLVARWWSRRQSRRWNALTMDQRHWLNENGMGVTAKRWPYRYNPHIPRGFGR